MNKVTIGNATLMQIDCMEYMATLPDNYFELAIVDPPYFENGGDTEYYRSRIKGYGKKPIVGDGWIIPDESYFTELFRVSKRQIIWGCNYYAKYIPVVGRIVWDKVNDNTPFSQCEIASYSEGVKVWLFRYKWNGMIQQDMKNKEVRIHPTQKPIKLYEWLLTNYAKTGDKILDTHGGSFSSAIACNNLGFEFHGCDLDADYFNAAVARVQKANNQVSLFEPVQVTKPTQEALL